MKLIYRYGLFIYYVCTNFLNLNHAPRKYFLHYGYTKNVWNFEHPPPPCTRNKWTTPYRACIYIYLKTYAHVLMWFNVIHVQI